MFIYSLSSRLDRIDPYWYARLMGLKAAYLATGLFIANLLLQPTSPTLIMLICAIGALVAEMPSINELDKKDNLYIAWIILVCLTVAIFSTTSFMQVPFIITVGAWAYFLYYLLRKKPETFAIVSALLMMGTISQEGLKIGNYFGIWNNTLFILEFALITFWLHKLFPFLYHKIWLSSLLRSLETLIKMLKNQDIEQSKNLRRHSMVSLSSLKLLTKRRYADSAKAIQNDMSALHLYFYQLVYNSDDLNLMPVLDDLQYLYHSVKKLNRCDLTPNKLIEEGDDFYCNKLSELVVNWNKLCSHVNS